MGVRAFEGLSDGLLDGVVLVAEGWISPRGRRVLHPSRTDEICVPGTYDLSNKVVALTLGARGE